MNIKSNQMKIILVFFFIIVFILIFVARWKGFESEDLKIREKKLGKRTPKEEALFFLEKGLFKDALIILEKEVLSNPSDWETQKFCGDCQYFLGNFEKAKKYFENSLRLNAESVDNHTSLAILSSEVDSNFEKAFEHIDEAERLLKMKINGVELWSLSKEVNHAQRAWIHFKKGDFLKAYEFLQLSIVGLFDEGVDEYDVFFSDVHYHFGMIYKKKGETFKARVEFNKAIKAGGDQNIFTKWSKEELKKMEKDFP